MPDDDRRREYDDDDDDRERRRRPRRRRDEDYDDDDDDYDDRPRRRRRDDNDPLMNMVVPLNTSPLAIAAGYVGLVSVLCIPAPFAILLGILTLVQLRKYPGRDGKVRAIFAIVMGSIFSLVLIFVVAAAMAAQMKK